MGPRPLVCAIARLLRRSTYSSVRLVRGRQIDYADIRYIRLPRTEGLLESGRDFCKQRLHAYRLRATTTEVGILHLR